MTNARGERQDRERYGHVAAWREDAATTCKNCGRRIINDGGLWIDPEATGDDSVWRETCDGQDTFTAEHEPTVQA